MNNSTPVQGKLKGRRWKWSGGAFSKPQLLSLAESDSRRFGKIHLGECEYSNHTQAGFVLAG